MKKTKNKQTKSNHLSTSHAPKKDNPQRRPDSEFLLLVHADSCLWFSESEQLKKEELMEETHTVPLLLHITFLLAQ